MYDHSGYRAGPSGATMILYDRLERGRLERGRLERGRLERGRLERGSLALQSGYRRRDYMEITTGMVLAGKCLESMSRNQFEYLCRHSIITGHGINLFVTVG